MKNLRLVLLLSCLLRLALASAPAADVPGLVVALPRATPESEGVDSAALLKFFEDAEERKLGLHSVVILRRGRIVAEGWWAPHFRSEPHALNSLTKSFTSTAIGFAVAEGKLSVEDPVLKFFPDEAPAEPGALLRALRVKHLLTMSTGHRKKDIESFQFAPGFFGGGRDLVRAFFAMPIADEPGTKFVYDSVGSHMLSEILTKVTGQTAVEYLRPRLFEPVGIVPATWQTSAGGVPFGGFGLYLRTEDIARFGQFYLQKGQWRGKQLLPLAWVETATSKQIENGKGDSSDLGNDWGQGYGYQFWRCRHGFFRGDGAGGQFCIVMPQQDTVVAITAGTAKMGDVMNLVWDVIVPALQSAPLPENPAGAAALQAKLRSLRL